MLSARGFAFQPANLPGKEDNEQMVQKIIQPHETRTKARAVYLLGETKRYRIGLVAAVYGDSLGTPEFMNVTKTFIIGPVGVATAS